MIPPLVIQMLVENCIKHNIISRENPLNIEIRAKDDSLTVINNLQPKSGVTSTGHGLSNIMDRYGFFTERKVEVQNNGNTFSVSIPLLKTEK
jgi:sensor histidine kinase YesM